MLGVSGYDCYALKLLFSHATLKLAVRVGWSVCQLIHPSVISVFFNIPLLQNFAHPPATGVSVYGLIGEGGIQIFYNISGSVHGSLHGMIILLIHSTKLSHALCRISMLNDKLIILIRCMMHTLIAPC